MNKISKAESGQSGFGFSLYHFIWQTADWLYPPVCAGCGKPDSRFCRDCFSQVITIAKPICEICGAPIQPNEKCPECEDHPPRFDRLRSWAVFSGPLREALHSLKYKSNLGIAEILAQPLISILNEEKWDFDVVIPIPLGKVNLRQRGYKPGTSHCKTHFPRHESGFAFQRGHPCQRNIIANQFDTRSTICQSAGCIFSESC